MRSVWASGTEWSHILAALMPENALAIECCLRYGLRIDDVLAFKTKDVKKGRFTIKEQKTGKARRIKLCEYIQLELLAQANDTFVFPHRTDPNKHRTRQAVWQDVKRACKYYRYKANITPHSARKYYANELRSRGYSLKEIQNIMNHTSSEVTMLYALSEQMRFDEIREEIKHRKSIHF